MRSDRLALYTTVYPGVEKYLAAWYQSVSSQTDCDFDLWIGVDSLSIDQVVAACGIEPCATWLLATEGDSPAQIRQKAIEQIVDRYSGVVFVDSDDLLHPSRVEAAREALEDHDVVACALRIIDEDGQDLGIIFGPRDGVDVTEILTRYNVFGLSNTAYRSEVLRRCLPFPTAGVLIDWLLATRAWASGSAMHFDHIPRMAYRQYCANVARVLPPFNPWHILKATERVLNHYHCVLATGWELPEPYRHRLREARDYVEEFYRCLTGSTYTLDSYALALNQIPPQYIWWWCVAHPDLEDIWKN